MLPHSPNKSTYSHSLQHPHNNIVNDNPLHNIVNDHPLHHLPLSPSKALHSITSLQNNDINSGYLGNTSNGDASRYLTESHNNGTCSNYLPMGNPGNSHNSLLPSGNSMLAGGNGNYSGNSPSSGGISSRVNDSTNPIEAPGNGDNYIDQTRKGLETTLQTATDLQNIIANSRSFNGYENVQSKLLDQNEFNDLSSLSNWSRSSVTMALRKPLDPRSLDIQFSDNTNIDSRGYGNPTECLSGDNPNSDPSLLRSLSSHHVQLCPITSSSANENMVPLTELPQHKKTSIGYFSSSNLPARSYGMPNSGSNGRLSRTNSIKAADLNEGKVRKGEGVSKEKEGKTRRGEGVSKEKEGKVRKGEGVNKEKERKVEKCGGVSKEKERKVGNDEGVSTEKGSLSSRGKRKSFSKEKGSLSSNEGNGCCKVVSSLLLCLLIFGSAIFGIVFYLHSE